MVVVVEALRKLAAAYRTAIKLASVHRQMFKVRSAHSKPFEMGDCKIYSPVSFFPGRNLSIRNIVFFLLVLGMIKDLDRDTDGHYLSDG